MKTSRSLVLAALIGASSLVTVHAADRTWNNAGTDYNTGANWTGGLPGTGDAAVFSTLTNQPNLSANITNQQVRFTSTTGGWTLTASPGAILNLSSVGTGTTAGTGAAIVSANTSGTNTISAPINFTGVAGSTHQINQNGAGGTLEISGPITSTNLVNLALAGVGNTATVTLSGNNNSFGGNVTISGMGTFNIGHVNALGSGAVVTVGQTASGNILTLNNTTGGTLTISQRLDLSATTASIGMGLGGSNDIIFNGGANINSSGIRGIQVATGRTLTINGGITESVAGAGISRGTTGGFAGTLILNGTRTYTGATSITGTSNLGTLTLNGASTGGGGVNIGGTGNVLNINHAQALGTGTLTFADGGTIDNTSGGAITNSNNNAISLGTGFTTVTFGGTDDLNLGTGAVSATGSTKTFNLSGSANKILTFGGIVQAQRNTINVNSISNSNSKLVLGGVNISDSATSGTLTIGGNGSVEITGVVANGGTATSGNLTYNGNGVLRLNGANTYNGTTTISGAGGVLIAGNATAIPGGLATTGGTANLAISNGATLGLGGSDLTRALGTGVDQLNISSSSAGFAAYGADRVVNFGGASAGLTWAGGGFMNSTGVLGLGHATSTHMVDFQNSINLGGSGTNTREIQVRDGSAAVDGRISGNLTSTGGTQSLNKTGNGTLQLTGTNTYNGATTISAGTLLISNSGSINGSSGVTVSSGAGLRYDSSVGLNRNVTLNGGRFAYNSAANYTGTLTFNSGTLAGSNFSGQTLTIGTNQTLAPGNSTGLMTAGATTWANGGTLQFELNNAIGTAGSTTSGWDLFSPDSLNITAGAGQFTIQVVSLDALQAAGFAQNFLDSSSYSWLMVDAGAAISGFDASDFVINTAGFQNAFTGTFSVIQGSGLDTDKLYLNYTAIPEPSTYAMLLGGLAMLVALRRRVKRSSQVS